MVITRLPVTLPVTKMYSKSNIPSKECRVKWNFKASNLQGQSWHKKIKFS